MLQTPWGDAESLRDRRPVPGRGVERDAARRERRERLFAAMVSCCARRGYEATSVADLLEAAGVSRATFYGEFDDKLGCFRATEEEIIAAALAVARSRLRRGGAPAERARATFAAFVEQVVAQPAAARMCIVDSYAAGEEGIAPLRAAIERSAALGHEALAQMPGREGMPAELARAVAGGFYQIIYNRLQARREEELPGLIPTLWEWAMSYAPPPRPLHRGNRRGSPPAPDAMPPFAAYSVEQRIIRAFAAVVAEKGYPATTIAEIAAAASISQTTFYLHFADKADALAAALDSSGAQMLAASLPGARRAPDWPAAIRAAFEATCGFLAAEPAFARLRMVEVYSAGPEAISMRDGAGMEFLSRMLGPAFTASPAAPDIVVEATVGAIYGVYYERIRNNGPADLLTAAPLLTYLALVPFLGAERACEVANGGPGRR